MVLRIIELVFIKEKCSAFSSDGPRRGKAPQDPTLQKTFLHMHKPHVRDDNNNYTRDAPFLLRQGLELKNTGSV